MRSFIQLVEGYEYQILSESARKDWLVATYGEKVSKKISPHAVMSPEQAIALMSSYDPTPNMKFTQWLCVRFLKNEIAEEDLYKAKKYLDVFDRAKTRIEKNDINSYKYLEDLYDVVAPFIEQNVDLSSADEKRKLDKEMREQSEILIDNEHVRIVVPETQEASCYWGKNTQWCTAATGSDNYFDEYGRLYIIIDKKNNKRFQVELESDSWMDENDRRVRPSTIINAYPEIIKAIGRKALIKNDIMPLSEMTQEELDARFEYCKTSLGANKFVKKISSVDDILSLSKEQLFSENFLRDIVGHHSLKRDIFMQVLEKKNLLNIDNVLFLMSKSIALMSEGIGYISDNVIEDSRFLTALHAIVGHHLDSGGGAYIQNTLQQIPKKYWGANEWIFMAKRTFITKNEVPKNLLSEIPQKYIGFFDHDSDFGEDTDNEWLAT